MIMGTNCKAYYAEFKKSKKYTKEKHIEAVWTNFESYIIQSSSGIDDSRINLAMQREAKQRGKLFGTMGTLACLQAMYRSRKTSEQRHVLLQLARKGIDDDDMKMPDAILRRFPPPAGAAATTICSTAAGSATK